MAVILDGAYGSYKQEHNVTSAQLNQLYHDAGSQIITTDSFNILFSDISHSLKLVHEACLAANSVKNAVVYGTLGPTEISLSLHKSVAEFDLLVEFYQRLILKYHEHGINKFIIETSTDSLNVKAALCALTDSDFVIVSCSPDSNGYLLDGYHYMSLHDMCMSYKQVFAFGFNCGITLENMVKHLRDLSTRAVFPISFYPNNEIPVGGEYLQSPQEFVQRLKDLGIEEIPLNFIGTCCGSTPEHIKGLTTLKYRDYVPKAPYFVLTGKTDRVTRGCIGESLNVYGSKKFKTAVENNDLYTIYSIAKTQIQNGAQLLDINLDSHDVTTEHKLHILRNLLNSDIQCPFVLDSSDFELIESYLKMCGGRPLVNSISLDKSYIDFKLKYNRIINLGASFVVSAQHIYKFGETHLRIILEDANRLVNPHHGHFMSYDPCINPACVDEKSDMRYQDIEIVIKELKKLGMPIVAGVSNFSFAFPPQQGISWFLECCTTREV